MGLSALRIELQNVSKMFAGTARPAVNKVSLRLESGEICALVGPSGCGKTTILRMINRLVEPSSGSIYIDGEDIMAVNPDLLRRGIGYVIQQIGLFPHRTVEENIALVPRLLKWPEQRISDRVGELLEKVGLDPAEVRRKYPYQLSGGQMQRIGVARALAVDPPLMLMDEPFGAVDPIVRLRLQDEFLALQQIFKKTICFVTHDMNEAMKMGDKIAIMNEGFLVQHGTPREILTRPADSFVKGMVGEDRGVKLLDLVGVEMLMIPAAVGAGNGTSVQAVDPAKKALQVMLEKNVDRVTVCRDSRIVGYLTWQAIKEYVHASGGEAGG